MANNPNPNIPAIRQALGAPPEPVQGELVIGEPSRLEIASRLLGPMYQGWMAKDGDVDHVHLAEEAIALAQALINADEAYGSTP